MFAAGIGPNPAATLEVRGHKSGRTISFPVVVADHQGERYLVAMLGHKTNWVRNLRAGDGRAVLQRRQREHVSLVEDLRQACRSLAPVPRAEARSTSVLSDRSPRADQRLRGHRRPVSGLSSGVMTKECPAAISRER